MSMIQELESAQAGLVAINSEFEAFKVGAAKAVADLTAAHDVELSAAKAELLAMTETNGKLAADIKISQDAVIEAQSAVAVANASKTDLEAKLSKAERALANPAFADAAMAGASAPVVEGGEATPAASGTPTWDEFKKIKDPAARTEFWQKHEAKLRVEMGRVSGG